MVAMAVSPLRGHRLQVIRVVEIASNEFVLPGGNSMSENQLTEERLKAIRDEFVDDPVTASLVYGTDLLARAADLQQQLTERDQQIAALTQERDSALADRLELLSALNGISPSLLNTLKRNRAGESTLSVKEHIAIAWADIRGWLDDYAEHSDRADKAEAELTTLREGLEQLLAAWNRQADNSETLVGTGRRACADDLSTLLTAPPQPQEPQP